MGGAIGVDSREGRGSLFWFTARLSPAAPAAPHLDPLPCGLAVAVAARSGALRGLLTRCLRAYGLPQPVTAAASVAEAEALFALHGGPPAVLVVCVDGPGRPGGRPSPLGVIGEGGRPAETGVAVAWRAATAEVEAALERHAGMRAVALCPLEGLGHLARLKAHPRCALLTRPPRFAALHAALLRPPAHAGRAGADDLPAHAVWEPTAEGPGRPRQRDSASDNSGRNTEIGCIGKRRGTRAAGDDSDVEGADSDILDGGQQKVGGLGRDGGAERPEDGEAGRMRVLVVDDDAGQRRVLRLMLEREGFQVRRTPMRTRTKHNRLKTVI
jgi:CheY-like chemotaxis protein